MYDFKNVLLKDEQIIYEGTPVPGKGDKNISGAFIILAFASFIQFMLIWSLKTKTGDGADGISLSYIIIFLVTLLFDYLSGYSLIYNLFIKKFAVSDDHYCLTNKRVLKYESRKDKLVYGYLINYEDIRTVSMKAGYGDLYMGIVYENTDDSLQDLSNIKDLVLNKDPENMPYIIFESIKSPTKVCKLAKEARKKLKENNEEK